MKFTNMKRIKEVTRAAVETLKQPTNQSLMNMDAFKCPPLSDFDQEFHPECGVAAIEVQRFVNACIEDQPTWLTLLGKSGVGKTMLARGISNYLRDEYRMEIDFIRWITVCNYMREGNYGVFDWMAERRRLIIDDIGASHETPLSKAKICELAERRLGKPTIWTSNFLLENIASAIDARVASRMVRVGNRVVQFRECPDWGLHHYEF